MSIQAPFKRLILRAVLRSVSPMVIRVLAVPNSLDLVQFDEVFRAVLGWDNIGFLFRVHGQEFNSFESVKYSGGAIVRKPSPRILPAALPSWTARSCIPARTDCRCSTS